MTVTLAGKEYTLNNHSTLKMISQANMKAALLHRALKKYGDSCAMIEDPNCDIATASNAIDDAKIVIDGCFSDFCVSAFVEKVECGYFDLSQKEAADLFASFFGGFTPTQPVN